jgi:uncharacterized 2Fe-2S/4Fe-4S cluster protein (DUF4445 family)
MRSSILFLPFKRKIAPDPSMSLLDLSQKLSLPLTSSCGGKKICGKCKVIIVETEGPLPEPSDRELEILGPLIEKGYRLACETLLTGDAVVRIPEESQIGRQVILTSATHHPYQARMRPSVNHYFVEVPPPTLDAPRADRERLLFALKEAYGIQDPSMDTFVLRELPHALRSDQNGLTAVIRNKSEIIAVYPGKEEGLFGMAFDIGTTTVVGFLLDLHTGAKLSVQSAMNPQIPFGDDVISRIASSQERPDRMDTLRQSMVDCLNALIADASAEARIDPSRIVDVTAAGNTAMHHFFVGLDARYLSMAPYLPVLQSAQDLKARDLGLEIGKSAYVHMLPLKDGFVGSDTMACILASRLHRVRIPTLLIDLGTNGEIVVGNREKLICCSTAAGPAFEGGHIRWGMRAAPGAIEQVKIDPKNLDVNVKTIEGKRPLGLCGSGIISAVAEMIRAGLVLAKGNFNDQIRTPRLRKGKEGLEFVLAWAEDSGTAENIVMTQKDISELQMAKSAVFAGARLLMDLFGNESIRRILLAGAGGNTVDPHDARTIGLFPASAETEIIGVGNAAGLGACLALLDKDKRKEAQSIAAKTRYYELSGSARFQELFVSSMFFTSAQDWKDQF